MGRHTENNAELVRKRLNRVSREIMASDPVFKALSKAASEVIKQMDADFIAQEFPKSTGNLYNSTAIAIYVGGALTLFKTSDYNPTSAQVWGDSMFWGSQTLQDALNQGAARYAVGTWVVLYASQPYAEFVNEEHTRWIGWFDNYSEMLKDMVSKLVNIQFTTNLKGTIQTKGQPIAENKNSDLQF